jgi:hypothetical protein
MRGEVQIRAHNTGILDRKKANMKCWIDYKYSVSTINLKLQDARGDVCTRHALSIVVFTESHVTVCNRANEAGVDGNASPASGRDS